MKSLKEIEKELTALSETALILAKSVRSLSGDVEITEDFSDFGKFFPKKKKYYHRKKRVILLRRGPRVSNETRTKVLEALRELSEGKGSVELSRRLGFSSPSAVYRILKSGQVAGGSAKLILDYYAANRPSASRI